ncbi:uncharacterized protein LOC124812840 [Hydra vulgaris]|uniref:uncharacterized protein LOC124812840 n=1 Tax=Hydra vulgaris TaxID=6087 RepID=UPI001F5E671C|nr:uncharacterized protein LOC124812840 [Hydra vulgaris]
MNNKKKSRALLQRKSGHSKAFSRRSFKGNQHTKKQEESAEVPLSNPPISSSGMKINLSYLSTDENGISNVTVLCDGSWQRRGFASLNGVVTVIASDTGKCLDYRVRSTVCKSCQSWEAKKGSDEYEEYISTHDCNINHTGSAGSMEAAALVDCFVASEHSRKLRYTKYIGDRDSKSYSDIVAKDPYKGIIVEKMECVGHIQKRVGGRLRKLKATNKQKLSDGKMLGDAGRLTEKAINKLQNYFGIAVRQSTGSTVYQLKKAIGAVLFHCSEAKDVESRHQMCPRTADSCLSDDNLLKKCLHGKTQNNNETLNGMIWKRCPKDIYVCKTTVELDVASAVINFNDGSTGILKVLEGLGVVAGFYSNEFCVSNNARRIISMERKFLDSIKKRRKHIRGVRKGFKNTNESEEEQKYGYGLF